MNSRKFVKQFQAGDKAAFDTLAQKYTKLLWQTARRMRCEAVPDTFALYTEGCIGLFNAAKEFNTDAKERFRPYAAVAVANAMRDYIRGERNTTEQRLIHEENYRLVSPSESVYENGELLYEEMIEDPIASLCFRFMDEYPGNPDCMGRICGLDKRSQLFLDYYFGLFAEEPHTLKETAEHFQIRPRYALRVLYLSLCKVYGSSEDLMVTAEQYAALHPEIEGATLEDKLTGIPVEVRRRLVREYEAFKEKHKEAGIENAKAEKAEGNLPESA